MGHSFQVSIWLSIFDEVNQELLIKLMGRKVKDSVLLKLICRFLRAGIPLDGMHFVARTQVHGNGQRARGKIIA